MRPDDVMEELWRVKDETAARYGYDIRALARALKEEQDKEGREVVSLPPRPLPAESGGTRRS